MQNGMKYTKTKRHKPQRQPTASLVSLFAIKDSLFRARSPINGECRGDVALGEQAPAQVRGRASRAAD